MYRMRKPDRRILFTALTAAACILLLVLFSGRVAESARTQQAELLRQAVLRAAVSCYATEGYYPPDLQHIIDHYGVQVDSDAFIVSYDAYADNLLPDIRVLERGQG